MLVYILQVLFFQLLFLLVYEFLLKKETFFTYNRWYLLICSVIPFLLPLIKIEAFSTLVPAESIAVLTNVWLPEVFIGNTPENIEYLPAVEISSATSSINWWFITYVVGVLGSLFLLFRKYQNLNRLFRFRAVSSEKDFRIIEVPNSSIACTFYKTVFLGDQLSEEEKQQILSHEMVHVKQKHSLDLIFFELLKIIFWFNPLIYIFQSRISTLHEFIADAAVVKTTEKRGYYEQLLNSAFNTQNISFINQFFNHSLIKKRIVMLQKSKSKTIAKIKYLLILPLLLVMLSTVAYSQNFKNIDEVVSVPVESKEEESSNNKKSERQNTLISSYQEKTMPFAVVEEAPEYPGCDQSDNEARKECLIQNINDHVNRNFNTVLIKPYMANGINRIIVQFQISPKGEITSVRSKMVTPGPDLEAKAFMEKEANRVVASLPDMKPGKHDGKVIGVMYALPLQLFNSGEAEKTNKK